MDIKGRMAHLSPTEQQATGLPSPIPVEAINVSNVQERLSRRASRIESMRAADNDELTHAERASIKPLTEQLLRDQELVRGMATQLVVHEAEMLLK